MNFVAKPTKATMKSRGSRKKNRGMRYAQNQHAASAARREREAHRESEAAKAKSEAEKAEAAKVVAPAQVP